MDVEWEGPDGASAASGEMSEGLKRGSDGRSCCAWAAGDALYRRYHDEEWGRPVADDRRLFEKLCLEGFQAGLSWLTILRKREAFREVFDGFAIERVAAMGDEDIDRLVTDVRIVRHRGKIASVINNARRTLEIAERRGSFAAFLWDYEPPAEERPERVDAAFFRQTAMTPASTRLSKGLRRNGFSFVGPTTVYAFMQSMGFVDDHIEGCHAREACERERAAFERPR